MSAPNVARDFSAVLPSLKRLFRPLVPIALSYAVVGALISSQGDAILGERQHAPELYKGECQCAIMWSYVFHPFYFRSISDLIAYLRDLRAGIPPFLSVLEIGSLHTFGSLDLVGGRV